MITADLHLHSSFSGDSDTPMEEMILAGIGRGLKTMCFTEHNDFGYPDIYPGFDAKCFLLNPDAYLYDYLKLKEKYAQEIEILFGLELGFLSTEVETNNQLCAAYPFDFIIGSCHQCQGKDPYFTDSYFAGKTDRQAYQEYFECVYEGICDFSNFDVCGHLDFVVRYGKEKDKEYSYRNHADILEAILAKLVASGKGLELNTAGLRSGLRDPHPSREILKHYREIGGEIITIGSDAHKCQHIASHFDVAKEILLECGFKYYCIFKERKPEFIKL